MNNRKRKVLSDFLTDVYLFVGCMYGMFLLTLIPAGIIAFLAYVITRDERITAVVQSEIWPKLIVGFIAYWITGGVFDLICDGIKHCVSDIKSSYEKFKDGMDDTEWAEYYYGDDKYERKSKRKADKYLTK